MNTKRKLVTLWLESYQLTFVKGLAARRGMGLSEYFRWLAANDAEEWGLKWPGPIEDTRGTYTRHPQLGGVFISVSNGRAHVARSTGTGETWARNWGALEDSALSEVEAQGGFATLSAVYDCSQELAEQAVWE